MKSHRSRRKHRRKVIGHGGVGGVKGPSIIDVLTVGKGEGWPKRDDNIDRLCE